MIDEDDIPDDVVRGVEKAMFGGGRHTGVVVETKRPKKKRPPRPVRPAVPIGPVWPKFEVVLSAGHYYVMELHRGSRKQVGRFDDMEAAYTDAKRRRKAVAE